MAPGFSRLPSYGLRALLLALAFLTLTLAAYAQPTTGGLGKPPKPVATAAPSAQPAATPAPTGSASAGQPPAAPPGQGAPSLPPQQPSVPGPGGQDPSRATARQEFVKQVGDLEKRAEALQKWCAADDGPDAALVDGLLQYLKTPPSGIDTRAFAALTSSSPEIVEALAAGRASIAAVREPLCKELCGHSTANPAADATQLDLCRFSDTALAGAAIIADATSVQALGRYMKRKLETITFTIKITVKVKDPMDPKKESTSEETRIITLPRVVFAQLRTRWPLAELAASVGAFADGTEGGTPHSAGTIDLAGIAARTADVALAALAQVIVDRAKREGTIWFLERMHDSVCKVPKGTPKESAEWQARYTIEEIRTYWLPATCSLASRRGEFTQYGGGADLIRALQGAVASDVKGWPGAAAGLGTGALFWKDLVERHRWKTGSDDATVVYDYALVSCNDPSPHATGETVKCATDQKDDARCKLGTTGPTAPQIEALCSAAKDLRAATAKVTAGLLAGTSAGPAFHEWGTAVDQLNLDAAQKRLYSDKLQAAACAASLPMVFQDYGDAVADLKKNPFDSTELLLLGAMASAPACATLTTRGWPVAQCPAFDLSSSATTACTDATKQVGLLGGEHVERLTTLVRWKSRADAPVRAVQARWSAVRQAADGYDLAVKALLQDASKDPAPVPAPTLNVGGVSDAKTFADAMNALEKYMQTAARTAQQSKQVRVLQAVATLAHTSVDLGIAFTDAGKKLTGRELFPGLCAPETNPGGPTPCDAVGSAFDGGRKTLTVLSKGLDAVDSALGQDWGQVVPKVLVAVRDALDQACAADAGCHALADGLSRYAGFFTALATDSNPDHVARALDAAAMPIGGWQRKRIPGSFTVSIAAFPGFATGVETRYGQYGAFHEAGGQPHWAAPTLVLPTGVDFAWGSSPLQLFVSVLDPAAYLQYDAEKQGRLPGAQVLTALAPGAWLRIAPWDAPFSINAYSVFRPALRAWESQVGGPAASAFQHGISLSVDVTLFEVHTRDPKPGSGGD